MDAHDAGERLEEIRTDVLVLFHPEDEPAPRGRLGRLDWILLGPLSRLGARGKFTGARGTSALLSPNQKVKAERILVMGVGRRADLSMTAFYRLSYDAAHTVLSLGCSRISLDLPYRLLPQESPEKLRHAFLEGFVAELKRGRPDGDFSVFTLPPTNGG
jgi:hypothetical protein